MKIALVALLSCTGIGTSVGLAVQQRLATPTLTPRQAEILSHMDLVDMEDDHGVLHRTLIITGVNVQIAAGDGSHFSSMQTGNLIVGYPNRAPSGSHNIIHGESASAVDSSSCLVSGYVAEAYNSVNSVVIGWGSRIENGNNDAVVGGKENRILNLTSGGTGFNVVTGGEGGFICGGEGSVIMGGLDNHIQSPGLCNTIAGGFQNFVAAEQAACLSSGDSFASVATQNRPVVAT